MKQTARCQCGHDVPFEEHDRGYEVYCPSCATACVIPGTTDEDVESSLEDPHPTQAPSSSGPPVESATVTEKAAQEAPPTSSPRRQSSIFSSQAAQTISERVVDRVPCLCGEEIPVRIDDFGQTVYCPKCGSEVQVGASLDRRKASRQATAVADNEGKSVPIPRARIKWIRSPAGIVVVLIIVATAVAVGYLNWDQRTAVLEFAGFIEPIQPEAQTAEGPIEFDPDKVTLEAIDALAAKDDPFAALMFAVGWRKGLRDHQAAETDPRFEMLAEVIGQILLEKREAMLVLIGTLAEGEDPVKAFEQTQDWSQTLRECDVPAEDDRLTKLEAVAKILIEIVDPITAEMIVALLTEPDSEGALVQAQLWREELRDRAVAADDLRLDKLTDVIQTLSDRLTPSPERQAEIIAEYRREVDRLFNLIRDKKLSEAIAAVSRIEEMLRQHADDLAPLTARFLSLKAKLERAKLLAQGIAHLHRLLKDSEAALDAGGAEVTEAWRKKSEALFLARRTPMTHEQSVELIELSKRLASKLQFARGARAVSDAKQCNAAGDISARDEQVRQALALLPGLPESQIRPYLEQIEEWAESSKPTADVRRQDQQPTSSIGRQLDRRSRFERALAPYGQSNIQELAAACMSYDDALDDAERKTDPRYAQLQTMLFDVLEVELMTLLDKDENLSLDEMRQRMVAINRALDQAGRWKHSAPWKSLDSVMRQHGSQFAQKSLDEANSLADRGQLNEALAAIEIAVALGDANLATRGRHFKEKWEHELQLRADREAEAASWQRIKQHQRARRVIAGWTELGRFIQVYPDSTHLDEAKKMKANVESYIQGQFETQLTKLRQEMERGVWDNPYAQLEVLEAAAITDDQRQAVSELRVRADEQKETVRNDFRLLGRRTKMFDEDDIIEVRRVVTLLLMIDPDDVEALQLLKQADSKGAMRAKILVEQAERTGSGRNLRYREKLVRARRLDPTGPYGKRAHEMLQGS